MYKSIAVIFFLLIHYGLSGQYQKSFRYTDSLTYSLYLEKNWEELIISGKEALDNGHDYYYMRMRIGIAYYERHNYALASLHFKKAREFNFNDQVVLGYLFYSAFLSNRHYQAWSILSGSFPETKKRIIEESRFKKHTLTLESFYSNFKTEELLSSPGDVFVNPEPGSQSITRYYLNSTLYGSHILGNNLAYFHSYTNLIKESYLHYFNGTNAYSIPEQKLFQNQYYGAFNFNSPGGWSFTPAFHIIITSYPYPYSYGYGVNSGVSTSNINDFGYVSSFSVRRLGGYISFGAEAGFSKLNYLRQAQGSGSLTIYPLGNQRLYLGGSLSAIFQIEDKSEPFTLISGIMAGFSISNKLWFVFDLRDGLMRNFIENNGLFVYNSSDILERKISTRLIVPLNKPGISFYAGYSRSWFSSEWIPEDGVNSINSNIIKYLSNNFTGGISWNF